MKLVDKNKILSALRNPDARQCTGITFDAWGGACALGQVVRAYWGEDVGISMYNHPPIISLLNSIGLDETIQFKGRNIPISDIFIMMNDEYMEDLNFIADWFEENVIPEDLPVDISEIEEELVTI